ncbi:MAG TPA: hypothetical protein VHS31_03710 [Tepidisphaeraceae bacterium]|nr:hypothetical protein [Tepidisphaeraceae bacterium]
MVIIAMATLALACANHKVVGVSPPPASQHIAHWQGSFYQFDDPRCTPEQRQAIRAAVMAVFGTSSPAREIAKRLHFSCDESNDGWFLTVWVFNANESPTPGGFCSVYLNRDLSVRKVVGGA